MPNRNILQQVGRALSVFLGGVLGIAAGWVQIYPEISRSTSYDAARFSFTMAWCALSIVALSTWCLGYWVDVAQKDAWLDDNCQKARELAAATARWPSCAAQAAVEIWRRFPQPRRVPRRETAYSAPRPPPHRTARSLPRRGDEPLLFPMLLPVLIVSLAAMMHIASLARLSELQAESRRLDRLMLEQNQRRDGLLLERTRLTDTALLRQYAAKHGMVYPKSATPVRTGTLSANTVHWPPRDETSNTSSHAPPSAPRAQPAVGR